MSTSTKSLEELVAELPPALYPPVCEYVEYLLSKPTRDMQAAEAPEIGPEAQVSLREITAETVRAICNLSETLKPPKKFMVAPNAVSIAQAHFEPKAWFRAIYADNTPVGFIMLYDNPGEPPDDGPEYFLWRLMVAQPHHGKDFGRRAIELLIEYVKTRPGAKELLTSCVEGPGSPEGFYHKVGFERTGEMFGEEVGLRLIL